LSDEEKYLEIREKLRNLETVKASSDFTNRLHLRIIEEEASRRSDHIKKFDAEKGGFLRNLFANRQYPWLIPAVGFTMVIFFVFYITFLSRDSMEENFNKSFSSNDKQDNESITKDTEIQKHESKAEVEKFEGRQNSNSNENNTTKSVDTGDDLSKNKTSKTNITNSRESEKPELGLVESTKPVTAPSDATVMKEEVKTNSDKSEESKSVESEDTGNDFSSLKKDKKDNDNNPIESRKSDNEVESAKEEKQDLKNLLLKLDNMDKSGLENIRKKIVEQ